MAEIKEISGFPCKRSYILKLDGENVPVDSIEWEGNLDPNIGELKQECSMIIRHTNPKLSMADLKEPFTFIVQFSTLTPVELGPYKFEQTLQADSVTALPFKSPLPDGKHFYAYKITANHHGFTHEQLALRRNKVYQGDIKTVIGAVLEDCQLTAKQYNLNLNCSTFTSGERYFMQRGETSEQFLRTILQSFAAIMYRGPDNVIHIFDKPTGFNSANVELNAHYAPLTTESPQASHQPAIQIYRFQKTLRQASVLQTRYATSPAKSKQLNSGSSGAKQDASHQFVSADSSLDTENANKLAERLQQANIYNEETFTGVTTLPLALGNRYIVNATHINETQETIELTIVNLKAVQSCVGNIGDKNLEAIIGIPNGTVFYKFTAIRADKLPSSLPDYTLQPSISLAGVVLGNDGKETSKGNAGEIVRLGLFSGNTREASTFADSQIIEVSRHEQPVSFSGSMPVPGTIVEVSYNPNSYDFVLGGVLKEGKFILTTRIQCDDNATEQSIAYIELAGNEVFLIVGTKKTKLSLSEAGMLLQSEEKNKLIFGKDFQVETPDGKCSLEAKSYGAKFSKMDTSATKVTFNGLTVKK
jgi:hypothetical protein